MVKINLSLSDGCFLSLPPGGSVLDNTEVPPVEHFKEEDGWLFVLGHNMLKKRVGHHE